MVNKGISRRSFLKTAGAGAAALTLSGLKSHNVYAKEIERFMFNSPSQINTMDPAATMDVGRSAYRLNFYDGLLRWRNSPPELTPNLGLSYESSPDGTTWTFQLRKDALFHDGSAVTADDVVYTTERLLALGTGAAGVFAPILVKGNTKALDKQTVQFKLKKPFAAFAGLTHFLHILNEKVLQGHEKNGDWGSAWLSTYGTRLGKDGVGTGSYTVEMYDPAVGFDGAAFKDHFLGWDHPHMEKVGYRNMNEVAARVLSLMKGEFHGELGYLPYEQLQKVKTSPKIQVIEKPSMRLFFTFLHCKKPPTSDIHFRKAVCHAFDYKSWISQMQHNMVDRNIGPVPHTMWGSLDPKSAFGYDYDLDKAKEELKKCKVNWKKYLPLEQVTLLGYPMTMEGAQVLQAGLNKIGITNKISPKPWATCTEIARKPETAANIWWCWRSTYYADPHNWIGEMYDSEKWGSWPASSFYKNEEVDARLHKAISIVDQKEREKLYREAGEIVVKEAPAVFIHNEKWTGTFNVRVKGLRFCPVGDANEWRWLSLS